MLQEKDGCTLPRLSRVTSNVIVLWAAKTVEWPSARAGVSIMTTPEGTDHGSVQPFNAFVRVWCEYFGGTWLACQFQQHTI